MVFQDVVSLSSELVFYHMFQNSGWGKHVHAPSKISLLHQIFFLCQLILFKIIILSQ